MGLRNIYRLDLDRFVRPEPELSLGYMIIRSPQVVDLEDLARLMLDAYKGTIDMMGKHMKTLSMKCGRIFQENGVARSLWIVRKFTS